MTPERSRVGHEIEAALGEVLAQVRGEVELPRRPALRRSVSSAYALIGLGGGAGFLLFLEGDQGGEFANGRQTPDESPVHYQAGSGFDLKP